jgi:hypothetical protein
VADLWGIVMDIDYNCCNKVSIANLDYKTFNMENGTAVEKVNRLCMNCYQHWATIDDEVKEFNRKEWDNYVNRSWVN